MKILFEDYTFNAATKQITFDTTSTLTKQNILIITNVTDNIIIYNFANSNLGGTISNNVLTLTYDTTSMSNSDSLQIYLDLGEVEAKDTTLQYTNELLDQLATQTELMKRLTRILESNSIIDSANRQRVIVDNITTGTIATVSTVSTVTSLTNLNGMNPFEFMLFMSRNMYANMIRPQLTFS